MKGSPVGFGTDIGGSIRIPAGFNGLYGLRPSTGRLPYEGMANSFDGAPSILSVVGPLATTPAGLKLVVQCLLGTEPWTHDPLVHPMPWRVEQEQSIKKLVEEKQLTFAVYNFEGLITLHPPVKRAIAELVKKVKDQGHKVIEWQPPNQKELAIICGKAWSYDGGADARKDFELSGEDPKPQVIVEEVPQATATEIMENHREKREAEKIYMEYWNSTAELTGTGKPVDAIISPLAPFAAARPGKYSYYHCSTFVNVLDYTSVVVPVTKVDKNVDKAYPDFKPIDEMDKTTQESCKLTMHV